MIGENKKNRMQPYEEDENEHIFEHWISDADRKCSRTTISLCLLLTIGAATATTMHFLSLW